jgi:hypothetical protein
MRCSTPELLRLPGWVSRKVIGDGCHLGKHAGADGASSAVAS